MQHQQSPHNNTNTDKDIVLPQTGRIILGTLLLFVSVGVMSFLGVFS